MHLTLVLCAIVLTAGTAFAQQDQGIIAGRLTDPTAPSCRAPGHRHGPEWRRHLHRDQRRGPLPAGITRHWRLSGDNRSPWIQACVERVHRGSRECPRAVRCHAGDWDRQPDNLGAACRSIASDGHIVADLRHRCRSDRTAASQRPELPAVGDAGRRCVTGVRPCGSKPVQQTTGIGPRTISSWTA